MCWPITAKEEADIILEQSQDQIRSIQHTLKKMAGKLHPHLKQRGL
jgi:hypothetical protein